MNMVESSENLVRHWEDPGANPKMPKHVIISQFGLLLVILESPSLIFPLNPALSSLIF